MATENTPQLGGISGGGGGIRSDSNAYVTLNTDAPLRFPPVDMATSVFFDEANKQVPPGACPLPKRSARCLLVRDPHPSCDSTRPRRRKCHLQLRRAVKFRAAR